MSTQLADRLAGGDVILIDGATGTEIERRGVPMVDGVWSGAAALTHPEVIQAVHEEYIRQGAEVIIANTYACSRHVLDRVGIGDEFERLNRVGVEIALAARAAVEAVDVVVAGSISTTEMGREQPPVDVGRVNYRDQARIQAEAGAQMIALEMLREITQTQLALDGVRETGLPVWVGYACRTVDSEPWLWNLNDRLADALGELAGQPIELVAIMHTEIDDIDISLDVLQEHWGGPIGVYAQMGRLEGVNWVYGDTVSPAEYTKKCLRWVDRGVQVIGGCCGIGPEHIAHLRANLPRP